MPLEADGQLRVYDIESHDIVAEYEGLNVHFELEFLRWFYAWADFGPGDEDVRREMLEEYDGELPEGWHEEL